MAYSLHAEPSSEGVTIKCIRKGLLGGPKIVSPNDWPEEKSLPGLSLLSYLIGAEQATQTDVGVRLSHKLAAGLTENQASLIGLPPSVPHALQLKSRSTLDQADFGISCKWLKFGTVPMMLQCDGSIASEGQKRYRIPLSLLKILEAVERFEQADTASRENRVMHWVPVQEALKAATGADFQPDGYLGDLRIFHAASLSLSIDITKERGMTFDPVLFGRAAVRRRQADIFESDPLADPTFAGEDEGGTQEGLDTLVDESEQLLTPSLQEVFLRKRFDRDEECREAYPLERNTYLVFDPQLRRALNVIKRKQVASEQERRAFIKNPRAHFAEALGTAADLPEIAGLFVETQQYADRVTGIGLWKPKVLPWLPQAANSWLPEKIGFYIGGETIEVAPESLGSLREACKSAMVAGEPTFSYREIQGIPAGDETLRAIEALRDAAERLLASSPVDARGTEQTSVSSPEKPQASDRFVLEQEDNLEELLYTIGFRPREPAIDLVPPKALIDPERLFPHQREAFDWMVKSWRIGRPGILLADDMGLGKTIQALTFAGWLNAHYEAAGGAWRGPFLIVAPTALLQNWRAEHDKHLRDDGIGPIVELYGSGVGAYRNDGESGRDVAAGHGVLDRDRLASPSVILTTYETLANYHMSFAAIRFPLVVFDEIQKLKTPTTINTHAAKTINADFVIGLTGTPVENSLTDLWSIMDRLHPGLFKDLKAFNQRFTADDIGSLQELRDALVNPIPNGSSVMLRRMKNTTDLGKALPPREFYPMPKTMPEPQAHAYNTCVAEARREKEAGAARGAMLQVLQRMRSISLHPQHPLSVLGRPELYGEYISHSARLSETVEILDRIRDLGEKALVFIEFREMQNVIADILRHRYHLNRLPAIINGQTPSAKRQELVNEFQEQPAGQLDVMILAPRAAGVGLTMTAANHVIHLSRWWNPAVEDQCNDRAYRIGQNKQVSVYYPIARHPAFGDASFDVTLDALLQRKRTLSRDLLVPMENDDDYRQMFDITVV